MIHHVFGRSPWEVLALISYLFYFILFTDLYLHKKHMGADFFGKQLLPVKLCNVFQSVYLNTEYEN